MNAPWHIVTFYKFLPIATGDVEALRDAWRNEGEALEICGLFLVAEEGVNATIAGSEEHIETFLSLVEKTTGTLTLKISKADKKPFKRWKVSIREEIVALGKPSMHPSSEMNRHLTPEEFKKTLDTEDVVLIDARNTYETAIGKFKNAFDPQTKTFQEFPDAIRNANIPKDKKVLMYCTGGIRCEKALMEMQQQGYEHVYQLQGGILSYIEQFPATHFEGECFVFDHRVAVDQALEPTKTYGLCAFCGDPGAIREPCLCCKNESVRCVECAEDHEALCSKLCVQKTQQARRRMAPASA